jgi:hypothetical protein
MLQRTLLPLHMFGTCKWYSSRTAAAAAVLAAAEKTYGKQGLRHKTQWRLLQMPHGTSQRAWLAHKRAADHQHDDSMHSCSNRSNSSSACSVWAVGHAHAGRQSLQHRCQVPNPEPLYQTTSCMPAVTRTTHSNAQSSMQQLVSKTTRQLMRK